MLHQVQVAAGLNILPAVMVDNVHVKTYRSPGNHLTDPPHTPQYQLFHDECLRPLIEALEQKEIAGAGLDVFVNEPISISHPLLQFENVIALPHIGSSSKETRMNMIELAIRNVV